MGNHEHESKHLSADGERQRNDKKHEKCHLCYKEHKDLCELSLACFVDFAGAADEHIGLRGSVKFIVEWQKVITYKTVIECHLCCIISSKLSVLLLIRGLFQCKYQ